MYLHTASVLYYFVLAALAVPTFAAPAPAAEVTTLGKRDISQALFDELVLYAKWSQTARPDSCPKPLGNTLVQQASVLRISVVKEGCPYLFRLD